MADSDLVGQYYLANALRQGQRQSPRSMLAQRMMQNALDTSPTTPLGALARALTGVVSAYTLRQAEEGDRLDQKQALGSLMDRDQQQIEEARGYTARLNGQGGQQQPQPAAPALAPVMREALPDIGAPGQGGTRQNPAEPGATPPAPSDLVARIIQAEAGNQGPEGMAAVAHVIRNRAALTGRTPEEIVQERGQFEPWGNRRQAVLAMPPERFASAADIWQRVSGSQIPDPTGGATHFLNPDLQRQLGRPQPAWAPEGQGQRIGAHVFYARPEDFRRAQVAGPGAPTEPAAPGGTVEASPPGSVQATLDALRQQQGAPAAAAPPTPAAPTAAAPSAPPVNMQVLAEGLASNNPRIQRAAQAQLQALQLQRQTEAERRAEAAAGRAADAAARQAQAAERQAAAAGRGPLPRGMQINPATGQLEDIPGMPREPFAGDSIDAQASNVLLRIGPRIANGTANDQERQQYALAHSHLTAPSLQQVPADPNDPSRGMALAMVPRRAPEGFPAPDFRPQAAAPAAAPPPAAPGGPAPGGTATAAAPGAAPSPLTPAPAAAATLPTAPGGAQIIPGTARGQTPLTEAQGRANMFGSQMRMGDDIIRNVQIPSGAAQALWRHAPEMVVNLGLSTNDQQYFNAVRLFAAGVLRRETGAAFTQRELEDVQSRFFPMPGDSQQVITQKAAARQQMISSMQAEIPGGLRGTIPTPGSGQPAGPVTHRFNPATGQVEAVH